MNYYANFVFKMQTIFRYTAFIALFPSFEIQKTTLYKLINIIYVNIYLS